MIASYNLRAFSNATFALSLDFSQVAANFDLFGGASVVRMQARLSASAPDQAGYGWATDGSERGRIAIDPKTLVGLIVAAAADMEALAALSLDWVYDMRLELMGLNSAAPLLAPACLRLSQGVSRTGSDLTAENGTVGIADSVQIEGYRGPFPAPIPMRAGVAAAITPDISLDFATAGDWMFCH